MSPAENPRRSPLAALFPPCSPSQQHVDGRQSGAGPQEVQRGGEPRRGTAVAHRRAKVVARAATPAKQVGVHPLLPTVPVSTPPSCSTPPCTRLPATRTKRSTTACSAPTRTGAVYGAPTLSCCSLRLPPRARRHCLQERAAALTFLHQCGAQPFAAAASRTSPGSSRCCSLRASGCVLASERLADTRAWERECAVCALAVSMACLPLSRFNLHWP